MNKNICNNCGKNGHLFHQCKFPITSYGVILFRIVGNVKQYLMIRRKNTFGYIDFMRGKYSVNNIEHLQHLIDEMTLVEKTQILNAPNFESLWKFMWEDACGFQNRGDEIISCKKFDMLKSGFMYNENFVNLEILISESSTNWMESEWEFPKGRKNYQEKDIDCALREFEEETGYSKTDICIVENVMPFEEIFIGSNHKSYKHKYYFAYMEKVIDELEN
jgi:NUDIX domain